MLRSRSSSKSNRASCWVLSHCASCILIGSDWQWNHWSQKPSSTGQHSQFVGFCCCQFGNSLLSTSLLLPFKSCCLVFSLSIFLLPWLSWRERGPGLGSVAELRFRTSGGMVEPLIHRKEKGDRALRKRTHLGSVRHKFSLPLACLRCFQTQTLHKGSVVCSRYHTGSTIPQEFKLYVQTSLGIHIMTADIENPNFMKSLFKTIFLLLLPSWTPKTDFDRNPGQTNKVKHPTSFWR